MIPPPFKYLVPQRLSDAIGLLEEYGADAKILVSSQSLIPVMKLQLAADGGQS